jgi:hypothetical protein
MKHLDDLSTIENEIAMIIKPTKRRKIKQRAKKGN